MNSGTGVKINPDWLHLPQVQQVLAAMTANGAQALFVGGCVRNALLGTAVPDSAVTDIDIATDALPAETTRLLKAAGLRALPTGIDHGTITAIADGLPLEITTFRADVATDGRRATVAFATDIATDAARRDFTMNALYATGAGEVLDPLNGLPDLRARRIRFIGDPGARIREDYLRILRFFRFQAWYGAAGIDGGGIDAEGLAACAAHLDGLKKLSRERVGSEIAKLLNAADPAPSIASMAASGVLARILPGANPLSLGPLVMAEQQAGIGTSWRRRLAAMMPDKDNRPMADLLRLSRKSIGHLNAIAQAMEVLNGAEPEAQLIALAAYRHGAEAARDAVLIRAASLNQTPFAGMMLASDRGARLKLPVRAADLIALGDQPGPALGEKLAGLEAAWIKSDFSLDAAQLLKLAG